MIQTIRSLEEEIKTLSQPTFIPTQQHPIQHTPSNSANLLLSNSFEILSTIPETDNSEFTPVVTKKHKQRLKKKFNIHSKPNKMSKSSKKQFNRKRTRIPFQNVTVVGDSHCRGLAALMKSKTANTSITGVCKPGAGLREIAPASTPPDHHAYVIVAGTNDVTAGREAIIFQRMEGIIMECRRFSKVLVSPLPPRHDLPPGSPIHETVALVNNFISELCCRYEGVEVVDLGDLSRRHFTRHGLHLNAAGKTLLADQVVMGLSRMSSPPRRQSPEDPAAASPGLSQSPRTSTQQPSTYLEATIGSQQPRSPAPLPGQQAYKAPSYAKVFLGTPLDSREQN